MVTGNYFEDCLYQAIVALVTHGHGELFHHNSVLDNVICGSNAPPDPAWNSEHGIAIFGGRSWLISHNQVWGLYGWGGIDLEPDMSDISDSNVSANSVQGGRFGLNVGAAINSPMIPFILQIPMVPINIS